MKQVLSTVLYKEKFLAKKIHTEHNTEVVALEKLHPVRVN
jgi:hypothetical protein